MSTILKPKPVAVIALFGVAGVIFLTQAFTKHQESESRPVKDYVLGLEADDFTAYTHPNHGFSFTVPTEFIVSTYLEDEGEVIVAQHPTLNLALQVFISPFVEEGPITAERIEIANPHLNIEDTVEFEMQDGTPAVRFAGKDPVFGVTRQIWFARGGTLYQAVLSSDDHEWLDAWVREMGMGFTFSEPESYPAL